MDNRRERAWGDARAWVTRGKEATTVIVGAVVTPLVVAVRGPSTEWLVVAALIGGLAGLLVPPTLAFFWSWARAPSRERWTSLFGRLDAIEGRAGGGSGESDELVELRALRAEGEMLKLGCPLNFRDATPAGLEGRIAAWEGRVGVALAPHPGFSEQFQADFPRTTGQNPPDPLFQRVEYRVEVLALAVDHLRGDSN